MARHKAKPAAINPAEKTPAMDLARCTDPKTTLVGPVVSGWNAAPPDVATDDIQLANLKVHQGSLSIKSLGDHQPGAIVDAESQQEYPLRRFIILEALAPRYKKYGPQGVLEETVKEADKDTLPAEALNWTETREGENNIPPTHVKCRTFYMLFEGDKLPARIELKSKTKKVRKLTAMFITALATYPNVPIVWELFTDEDSNAMNTWPCFGAKRVGLPPTEDHLATAIQWKQQMKQGKFVVAAASDEKAEQTPFD